MKELIAQLKKEKLLPLYTATDLSLLDSAEEVLIKNNLNFVEVTYRSELASKAIEYLSESGKLIVGAGTVRDLKTAREAVEHGANFIVTPGFSVEILEFCQKEEVICFPGAVTPTEIMTAASHGVYTVKFFPSDVYGGLKALDALKGPFFDINFIPTGGINAKNVNDFLAHQSVIAVGGSFIFSEKDIAQNGAKHTAERLKNLIESLD